MTLDVILQRLNSLATSSNTLSPDEADRMKLVHEAAAFAHEFIGGLDTVKGYRADDVADLSIGSEPIPFNELLVRYDREVVKNGINAASPKHLGYIPGGGVFASAIADFLVAVTNPFSSAYFASPGAATMENTVVDWMKSVFSFPDSSVGCLTSGGSVSTLIALTAARDKHRIKNEKIPTSVVYMSEQVHHSTQKALRIIGLEDVIIRYVPMDNAHRIIPDELNKKIIADKTNGLTPFLVIATAGTTDTGTVDPLNDIADVAEQHGLWYHVDAAYGGFFILTSKKQLFTGIERADSLIVDPHKGLFLPYGVGVVLVKDADSVLHSHYYTANYMQDANNVELLKSPANLSPELTKHFRGLRVWLPLQLHGIEPFTSCLEEKLLLTEYFRIRLLDLGFCVGPTPDLSVSYFWYPFSADCDEKNKQLINEIHHDGSVFLSSSVIDGRFVIRIAILAFRTKQATVDEAIEMIEHCLHRVLQEE